jgi:hypothetical protein
MRKFREILLVTAALAGTVGVAGAAEKGPGPDTEVVAGSWQHHSMKINYFGITTLFSCSALEDHVKDCVPHQLNFNGYHVKANALIAVPLPKANEAKRS